jgi:anti-sigma B factor antagonist
MVVALTKEARWHSSLIELGDIAMLKVHAKNLGTVAVLNLEGQIVYGETEILHTAVHSISTPSAVILDLAQVSTIDAHGFGVMLELREQAEAKGIRFELMNISKMIRKVMELARLDSVFQISSGVQFFPAVSHSQQGGVAALKSCA